MSTDFEGIPITCVNGDLAVALGFGQVTFNSGNAATMMSPCIEDASDLNGWTSPLSGRYVFVEIQPDNPATLTFDMPVASVSFDVGPHYQQDSTGNIALCGTTAGTCENADVVADQSTPGTMMMDMAGETTLFVFMNKGIGNIGIDNLQVCFD